MASLRALIPLAALAASAGVRAQDDAWLDSKAAREFRQRVADLAFIYGDARGIDAQGLLIIGKRLRPLPDGCAEIDIAIGPEAEPLRREPMRGCKPHAS